MSTIHKGDIGTKLQVQILEEGAVVDISAGTAMTLILTKPSGTKVTKTAVLAGNGTDGKLEWATTVVGDLDEVGQWQMQASLTIGAWTGKSDIIKFDVRDNL